MDCWRTTVTSIGLIPFCINGECTMKLVVMEPGGITNGNEIITWDDQRINGDYKPLTEDVYPSIGEFKCDDECQPRTTCRFTT